MTQDSSENKVVINGEDIKNIEDFFEHFKIPMPSYLREQLDVYRANPEGYTYDDQCRLKSEIAHALVEADHELLKDELFANVIKSCNEEWYNTQFQRDLEQVLTEDQSS